MTVAPLTTISKPSPAPLRHAYHMVSGEEGHARRLSDGRVSFAPGGHKFSFVCSEDEVCQGPAVQEGR